MPETIKIVIDTNIITEEKLKNHIQGHIYNKNLNQVVELKVKNQSNPKHNIILKKVFQNPETINDELNKINEIKPEDFNIKTLYNLGFRADNVSLCDSIQKNWSSIYDVLKVSSASSAVGSLLLMTVSMWPIDPVIVATRALNATLPPILTALNNYHEDNKYSWDKSTYDKYKLSETALDFITMFATLGETYGFNRANIEKVDPQSSRYNFSDLFKSFENFSSVFFNPIAGPFLGEQIPHFIREVSETIHHATGLISEKTKDNFKDIINPIGAFVVTGAFANVVYNIWTNDMFSNLDTMKKTIATIGIECASYGANLATINGLANCKKIFTATGELVSSGFSWCKSLFLTNDNEREPLLSVDCPDSSRGYGGTTNNNNKKLKKANERFNNFYPNLENKENKESKDTSGRSKNKSRKHISTSTSIQVEDASLTPSI